MTLTTRRQMIRLRNRIGDVATALFILTTLIAAWATIVAWIVAG